MSKPRHRWWGYVKNVVREYPKLTAEHVEWLGTTTASLAAMGESTAEPTWAIEAYQAVPQSQREYEAVRCALEVTRRKENGVHRIKLLEHTYWNPRCGALRYAALHVPCSDATAKRWHGDFIRLVAGYLGLTGPVMIPPSQADMRSYL